MTIQIEVLPGLSPDDVTIRYHGSEVTPATSEAIQAGWSPKEDFQSLALRLVRSWLGYAGYGPSTPNYAWAANTPDANWKSAVILDGGRKGHRGMPSPPRARLEAVDAKVVSISEQTVLVDHAIWNNRNSADPLGFESSINQSVSESVGSSWEKSQSVEVGGEVGVEVGGVGAKTSVAYTTSWGESHSIERSQELGTSDSIHGELAPGELKLAALVAKRGTLIVDVLYHFDALDGYLLAHTRGHKHGLTSGQTVRVDLPGHPGYETEWIAVPFREAIRVWYGRTSISNTQRLTIGFFADAELTTFTLGGLSQADIDAAAKVDSTPVEVYPKGSPQVTAAG